MGLPFLDKGVGRLTHIPRQLGILPERAKTVKGATSVLTGGKKKKKKSILSETKGTGASLTSG